MTHRVHPTLSTKRAPSLLLNAALLVLILLPSGVLPVQRMRAQTLTVLYSFTGSTDGQLPGAGVIRDSAGNLYGTTGFGGTFTWGAVFKLDAKGRETVLYNFTGGTDGALPNSGLLRDSSGNLYGTTDIGGNLSCNNTQGCGTVFEVSAGGKESVLHSFGGSPDGKFPVGIIRDTAGNIYGATMDGGGTLSNGTVFKLNSTGKETILYSFGGGTTGAANPTAGVVRNRAGTFYGAALGGPSNFGTVFQLSSSGQETVLYTFSGRTDGGNPFGGLLLDSSGNLYGTTEIGGTSSLGTVFKVDQTGKESVLHSFTGADGTYPLSALIRDSAGNLYGSASQGGTYGNGTLFKLDTSGNLTTLHSFNGTDGQYPVGTLARDAAGNLYGTTERGGAYGWGTVFKLALQ